MASVNTNTELKSVKSISQQVDYTLRRLIMTCFLWEDTFYKTGSAIAENINILIRNAKTEDLHAIAIEAREDMNLRHVPLYIVMEMFLIPKHKVGLAKLIERVIQRPDDATELLALYWKDGKRPIPKQFKVGIGRALTKFNEYQLAKYAGKGDIKLVDLFNLVHPKPKDKTQEKLFKKFVADKLESPDTWEVRLSSGEDKKHVFTELIQENKLGGLAMLKNLRNMQEAKVDDDVIKLGIETANYSRVLPFRFISAAKYAPQYEPQLEKEMLRSTEALPKLQGKTLLLVDVSPSMNDQVSSKSDITRLDAACALSILLRETCEDVQIFTFDELVREIPNRRGFALRDAVEKTRGGRTLLGRAVATMNALRADRLIVFTDEESQDPVPAPLFLRSYMINVASSANTVTTNKWVSVTGFSEKIVDYIHMVETIKA